MRFITFTTLAPLLILLTNSPLPAFAASEEQLEDSWGKCYMQHCFIWNNRNFDCPEPGTQIYRDCYCEDAVNLLDKCYNSCRLDADFISIKEEFDDKVSIVNIACKVGWEEKESEERGVPEGYEAPLPRETTGIAYVTPGALPTAVSDGGDKEGSATSVVGGRGLMGFVIAGVIGGLVGGI